MACDHNDTGVASHDARYVETVDAFEECWVAKEKRKAVMCGRARLSTDYSEIKIAVKFDPTHPAPNIPASWNVCPTDPMLVAVLSGGGKRIPQQMRWGLIPWWAKDAKIGFSSIDARTETVDTTPAFRDAWKRG